MVRANKEVFKGLEQGAMGLVMLLPKSPEWGTVPTEGLYALIGLFTAVNDAVIHGRTKHEGEIFASADPAVHLLRLALTVLFHASALVEVSALAFLGPAARDRVVLLLEVAKAACRAALLRLFPGEVVHSGGHYESHLPPPPNAPAATPAAAQAAVAASPAEASWTGRRTGRALKLPQSLQAVSERLALRSRQAGGQFRQAGEWLFLLRPLVYTLLAQRWRQSWMPWAVSLGMDLAVLRCMALADKVADGLDDFARQLLNPGTLFNAPAAPHDAAELNRRRALLVMYLIRSPAYEAGLRRVFVPAAARVQEGEEPPSMFSAAGVAGMVGDQLDYYNRTHFYNSAS